MNASSGEPWSEDISDLTNEIAHGRMVAEVSFAGLPRECFVRNDRGKSCECIEWNACYFTALDRKGIRCTPCPEIINAIPTTPADRSPLSASRRDSIVRLRPRRRWWWRRRRRCWWRRSRRWCCESGRRKRRGGRHRRGYDGNHPRRNSPAGPSGSGNARWRRPGRLKFRRSVKRKHGGRSGRDRGAGAAHHQRSERWGWAKC